jgi:hypothetical protein
VGPTRFCTSHCASVSNPGSVVLCWAGGQCHRQAALECEATRLHTLEHWRARSNVAHLATPRAYTHTQPTRSTNSACIPLSRRSHTTWQSGMDKVHVFLLSGVASGVAETLTFPADVVKTRLQVGRHHHLTTEPPRQPSLHARSQKRFENPSS